MNKVQFEEFTVIGISVRTTNENAQSAQDIGGLFQRFMSEGLLEKIPNKVDNRIYSIYTEYEGDETQPYTVVLGCKVERVDTIPEGMLAKTVQAGSYAQFVAKGSLNEGVVYQEWTKIWATDLDRIYATDFEIYGEKCHNPLDAEVDIFVGVK